MGRRVDGTTTSYQYLSRMRRLWLTLLTAFAFVATGFAGAAAASACPMSSGAQVVAPAHDCCPDNQPAAPAPTHQKSDCLMMGLACRSVSVVAPSLAPIRLSGAVVMLDQPLTGEPEPPVGPLQEFWRPPRTV